MVLLEIFAAKNYKFVCESLNICNNSNIHPSDFLLNILPHLHELFMTPTLIMKPTSYSTNFQVYSFSHHLIKDLHLPADSFATGRVIAEIK